jgi:hypothetical protein
VEKKKKKKAIDQIRGPYFFRTLRRGEMKARVKAPVRAII